MKKAFAMFLLMIFTGTTAALAGHGASVGNSKKDVPENKKFNHGKAEPSPHAKGFWEKEAERSGFAGTAAAISSTVTGAIPLAKPNSGKSDSK